MELFWQYSYDHRVQIEYTYLFPTVSTYSIRDNDYQHIIFILA